MNCSENTTAPLLVSVVVPTKNRPAALVACLDALAEQSLPSSVWEVVVVDDGSDPALCLAIDRWQHRLRIRVIRQESSGPAAARHRGAAEAAGRVLAFTDDDCVPSPHWLETLVDALSQAPGALVGGTTVNGLTHDDYAEASQLILELAYEHFNRGDGQAMFFASNNIACTADTYHASGGFDPAYPALAAEDRDFCDRWRGQGRQLLSERRAVVMHRHGQSLSTFTRLHFRYGRGALVYQRRRRERGGTMSADLGFHRSLLWRLPRALRRYSAARRLRVAVLLGWWQIANAAGFAWESLRFTR
jgi:glycosyltransferase involved in cell wall biosynthesis